MGRNLARPTKVKFALVALVIVLALCLDDSKK
jgi:hypothetical protein